MPGLVYRSANHHLCERRTRRYPRTETVPAEGVGTTSGLLFEDDGESWGYQLVMRFGWNGKWFAMGRPSTESQRARGLSSCMECTESVITVEEKRTLLVNGVEGSEWMR